ncbi:MAG: FAD-binding oxidoreductase [Candidatus Rokubacteria bacterium]|nr:FAD-binding oxidoreductase [Candidatus Rokubacteria bacterium]
MQDALLDKLRAAVGPADVLTGVELSPYVVEGRTPEAAVFPGSVEEVAAVVGLAAEAALPVTPWGGGTAASVGMPATRAGLVLGFSRLNRLVEHEPGDLTATVEAGMTVAALQSALRSRGQWLSLDPPDAERATLGGVLATNASGPRRHLYGTARDLLIGVTVVTADGAVVKGGGKVVKNVAGYDLPKLFIGSYGTLGIIVEATVKLRPLPDDERVVGVAFDRLKDGGAAVRALMASDLIPNAVELLDAAAGGALGAGGAPASVVPSAGAPSALGALLVVGFDGLPEQVEWQCAELARLAAACGGREARPLAQDVWPRLATAARAAFGTPTAVMTFGVLPTEVAELMEHGAEVARARGIPSAWTAHAGVGHVSAALRSDREPQAPGPVAAVLSEWRTMARTGGGHGTLEWAPLAVKSQVPVWDDPGAAGRIMQRIKAQLDPHNLLNPGRFVAGL